MYGYLGNKLLLSFMIIKIQNIKSGNSSLIVKELYHYFSVLLLIIYHKNE